MIKSGTFTSVWDDGIEINSKATLDTETGAIAVLETSDVDGLDILDREYFTDEQGKEYEVCSQCHEHITKTEMVSDAVGCGLHEETRCLGGCDD